MASLETTVSRLVGSLKEPIYISYLKGRYMYSASLKGCAYVYAHARRNMTMSQTKPNRFGKGTAFNGRLATWQTKVTLRRQYAST